MLWGISVCADGDNLQFKCSSFTLEVCGFSVEESMCVPPPPGGTVIKSWSEHFCGRMGHKMGWVTALVTRVGWLDSWPRGLGRLDS